MEHHRMFNLFAKATGAKRVSDTLFKHKYLTQSTVSRENAIVAAAHQLMAALTGIRLSGFYAMSKH